MPWLMLARQPPLCMPGPAVVTRQIEGQGGKQTKSGPRASRARRSLSSASAASHSAGKPTASWYPAASPSRTATLAVSSVRRASTREPGRVVLRVEPDDKLPCHAHRAQVGRIGKSIQPSLG
jgi:hypothetical protein